jgi:hypothetical protein
MSQVTLADDSPISRAIPVGAGGTGVSPQAANSSPEKNSAVKGLMIRRNMNESNAG